MILFYIFACVNLIYKPSGSVPYVQFSQGVTGNVNKVYIGNEVYKKRAAPSEAALLCHNTMQKLAQ